MRFMVMVKATKDSEAGVMPDRAAPRRDGQVQRGAGQGGRDARRRRAAAELEGRARAASRASKRTVIDGPFAETKELIAGFWLWQVKSKDEAIEWVKRCPNPMPARSPRSRSARCSSSRTSARQFTPELAGRRSGCARRSSAAAEHARACARTARSCCDRRP